MSTADQKGCQAVQNLGAVQTYLRRYLWASLLELVEHDKIESETIDKQQPNNHDYSDEDINKAMKVAGLDKQGLVNLVKLNFSKSYKDLTQVEKNSLFKLIEKEVNK